MAQKTLTYLKSRFLSLMLPEQADYGDLIDSKQQTISQVVGGKMDSQPDGSCQLTLFPAPVGTVVAFAGNSLPSGWLWCDGGLCSRSGYPALFAAIGTTYGYTTSTNFRVPDLRGQFIRGWVRFGNSSTPDYGRAFGTTQKDAIQEFGGYMNDACMSYSNFGGIFKYKSSQYGNGGGASGDSVYRNGVEIDLAQGGVRTATETRPTNVAMNYIIRADYL